MNSSEKLRVELDFRSDTFLLKLYFYFYFSHYFTEVSTLLLESDFKLLFHSQLLSHYTTYTVVLCSYSAELPKSLTGSDENSGQYQLVCC